jgi:hypothetical protein
MREKMREKRAGIGVRIRNNARSSRSIGGSNLAKDPNVATMQAAGANGFVKWSARICWK